MALVDDIARMKTIMRETDLPFFSDSDLEFYINENNGCVNDAIYQCLIIKSENTSLSISGLTASDTSAYFLRIAQRYRPRNSGILG